MDPLEAQVKSKSPSTGKPKLNLLNVGDKLPSPLLGELIIDEEIASGGQGCVYRALVASSTESFAVALKLTREEHATSHYMEVRALTLLKHAGASVPALFDHFLHTVTTTNKKENYYIIVMEHFAWSSLSYWGKSMKTKPPSRIIMSLHPFRFTTIRWITSQIVHSLRLLHSTGLWNGDMSPSNVLIDVQNLEPSPNFDPNGHAYKIFCDNDNVSKVPLLFRYAVADFGGSTSIHDRYSDPSWSRAIHTSLIETTNYFPESLTEPRKSRHSQVFGAEDAVQVFEILQFVMNVLKSPNHHEQDQIEERKDLDDVLVALKRTSCHMNDESLERYCCVSPTLALAIGAAVAPTVYAVNFSDPSPSSKSLARAPMPPPPPPMANILPIKPLPNVAIGDLAQQDLTRGLTTSPQAAHRSVVVPPSPPENPLVRHDSGTSVLDSSSSDPGVSSLGGSGYTTEPVQDGFADPITAPLGPGVGSFTDTPMTGHLGDLIGTPSFVRPNLPSTEELTALNNESLLDSPSLLSYPFPDSTDRAPTNEDENFIKRATTSNEEALSRPTAPKTPANPARSNEETANISNRVGLTDIDQFALAVFPDEADGLPCFPCLVRPGAPINWRLERISGRSMPLSPTWAAGMKRLEAGQGGLEPPERWQLVRYLAEVVDKSCSLHICEYIFTKWKAELTSPSAFPSTATPMPAPASSQIESSTEAFLSPWTAYYQQVSSILQAKLCLEVTKALEERARHRVSPREILIRAVLSAAAPILGRGGDLYPHVYNDCYGDDAEKIRVFCASVLSEESHRALKPSIGVEVTQRLLDYPAPCPCCPSSMEESLYSTPFPHPLYLTAYDFICPLHGGLTAQADAWMSQLPGPLHVLVVCSGSEESPAQPTVTPQSLYSILAALTASDPHNPEPANIITLADPVWDPTPHNRNWAMAVPTASLPQPDSGTSSTPSAGSHVIVAIPPHFPYEDYGLSITLVGDLPTAIINSRPTQFRATESFSAYGNAFTTSPGELLSGMILKSRLAKLAIRSLDPE